MPLEINEQLTGQKIEPVDNLANTFEIYIYKRVNDGFEDINFLDAGSINVLKISQTDDEGEYLEALKYIRVDSLGRKYFLAALTSTFTTELITNRTLKDLKQFNNIEISTTDNLRMSITDEDAYFFTIGKAFEDFTIDEEPLIFTMRSGSRKIETIGPLTDEFGMENGEFMDVEPFQIHEFALDSVKRMNQSGRVTIEFSLDDDYNNKFVYNNEDGTQSLKIAVNNFSLISNDGIHVKALVKHLSTGEEVIKNIDLNVKNELLPIIANIDSTNNGKELNIHFSWNDFLKTLPLDVITKMNTGPVGGTNQKLDCTLNTMKEDSISQVDLEKSSMGVEPQDQFEELEIFYTHTGQSFNSGGGLKLERTEITYSNSFTSTLLQETENIIKIESIGQVKGEFTSKSEVDDYILLKKDNFHIYWAYFPTTHTPNRFDEVPINSVVEYRLVIIGKTPNANPAATLFTFRIVRTVKYEIENSYGTLGITVNRTIPSVNLGVYIKKVARFDWESVNQNESIAEEWKNTIYSIFADNQYSEETTIETCNDGLSTIEEFSKTIPDQSEIDMLSQQKINDIRIIEDMIILTLFYADDGASIPNGAAIFNTFPDKENTHDIKFKVDGKFTSSCFIGHGRYNCAELKAQPPKDIIEGLFRSYIKKNPGILQQKERYSTLRGVIASLSFYIESDTLTFGKGGNRLNEIYQPYFLRVSSATNFDYHTNLVEISQEHDVDGEIVTVEYTFLLSGAGLFGAGQFSNLENAGLGYNGSLDGTTAPSKTIKYNVYTNYFLERFGELQTTGNEIIVDKLRKIKNLNITAKKTLISDKVILLPSMPLKAEEQVIATDPGSVSGNLEPLNTLMMSPSFNENIFKGHEYILEKEFLFDTPSNVEGNSLWDVEDWKNYIENVRGYNIPTENPDHLHQNQIHREQTQHFDDLNISEHFNNQELIKVPLEEFWEMMGGTKTSIYEDLFGRAHSTAIHRTALPIAITPLGWIAFLIRSYLTLYDVEFVGATEINKLLNFVYSGDFENTTKTANKITTGTYLWAHPKKKSDITYTLDGGTRHLWTEQYLSDNEITHIWFIIPKNSIFEVPPLPQGGRKIIKYKFNYWPTDQGDLAFGQKTDVQKSAEMTSDHDNYITKILPEDFDKYYWTGFSYYNTFDTVLLEHDEAVDQTVRNYNTSYNRSRIEDFLEDNDISSIGKTEIELVYDNKNYELLELKEFTIQAYWLENIRFIFEKNEEGELVVEYEEYDANDKTNAETPITTISWR